MGNPVRVARTDLKLEIDRAKAGLLGIPTVEIERARTPWPATAAPGLPLDLLQEPQQGRRRPPRGLTSVPHHVDSSSGPSVN